MASPQERSSYEEQTFPRKESKKKPENFLPQAEPSALYAWQRFHAGRFPLNENALS
jgi:hypothetical protein